MNTHDEAVATAAAVITERIPERPEVFLTLGSGLSSVADAITEPHDIPLSDVPGLAGPGVAGHAGILRAGRLGGVTVLAQMGRVHLYEGHDPATVTRAVEAAAELGTSTYIVTNASGGLVDRLTPGDVLLITDQLNLTNASPLTAVRREAGPVFTDMSEPYDRRLRALALEVAGDLGLELQTGVYAGLRGPAYETPAEVAMLRTLGADVVGMSTVLEVIAARSRDVRVLGLSAVTNVHGPGVVTSHEEVLEVGRVAGERIGNIVLGVLDRV